MIFNRDKLTYEEVRDRFEREGYKLLSMGYKNAKSNLNVLCPRGHEWQTNISNFDFGRRCSVCSRKKKYILEEAQRIFAKDGYRVQDSIYINGKTSIKVSCPNGHVIEMNLNNFMNGRRCNFCRSMKLKESRMKKLELKLKNSDKAPWRQVEVSLTTNERTISEPTRLVKPEWLEKLDEMRKNLKIGKRHTYRESEQQNSRRAGPKE